MKKIVLSGIQSSGNLHLGNYLGAIKNWLTMQDEYDCYFFLADLHSLTTLQKTEELKKSIYQSTAMYLACGLDPSKVALFQQSRVGQHSQLAWMLNCVTPIGWLKRMTQFKDKAGKNQDNANTGLFTYPVLMAADILLYNAELVPVGADQKQHLELTRDIAGVINRKFDEEILKMPEPLIQKTASRIMSLRDGSKKMSKSDESDASRINLTDGADVITKKFKKAKTDNIIEIYFDAENRPDISNLMNIHSAFSGYSIEDITNRYSGKGFAEFKMDIADMVIEHMGPINDEYQRFIEDSGYIQECLNKGAEKAEVRAKTTCDKLMNKFGLL